MELFAIIVVGFMVVALTTLLQVYALRNSFDTFMIWDPPIHVLKFRLLICDACGCTDACAHVEYSDRRLYCELARPYEVDQSLYFERRIGLIGTDQSSRPISDSPSKDESGQCSQCDLPECPDLVTDGTELVIHNFDPAPDNQGWTQAANFSWSPGQDGWNSSSCAAHSQCPPCTTYDTRNTPQTAMRGKCRCDSECVDAESECRDGQCWCKPGLSHDPDSSSCVAQCPGEKYGSTFQEVRHFRNANSDRLAQKWDRTQSKTDNIHACFERSEILEINWGWVIKYGMYTLDDTNGLYICVLFSGLQNPVLNITKYREDTTSLILDCKK